MGRVYLIRHPATEIRPELAAARWGLSKEGHAQLEALMAAALWGEVGHVFSSPEPKAAIVAETASERHRVPLSLHPELRELERPPGLIGNYEQVVSRVLSHWSDAPDGWEPVASGLDRAWGFLESVVRLAGTPTAVVSHGLILCAVRARLLGKDAVEVPEWKRLPFASVAVAETEPWALVEDFAVYSARANSSIPHAANDTK